MKKIQYIRPEIHVCDLDVQNMMAASPLNISHNPADSHLDVETNDNKFTDIWGNEY